MTEITDLSTTDSSNTTVTGESIDGAIANMGRMDNTLQAILGLLARSIRTNVLRFLDNSDPTKKVALDLSGLPTSTERTWTAPYHSGTVDLQAMGTAIASASTVNLALATGSTVHITGTTNITSFGTVAAGVVKTVIFDGILTVTYNGTSMRLFSGVDLITYAGMTLTMVSEGSGNWREISQNEARGTWTPSLSGNTIPGTGTYSTRSGRYTRLGRLVHFQINLVWSAHTGTGTMTIDLPFTGTLSEAGAATVLWDAITYTSPPMCRIDPATPRLVMLQAASNTPFAGINIEADGGLYVSGWYMV